MKRKDELKASTVSVILSAQRHKFERSRDDINYNNLNAAYTHFRKNIFELKKAAKRLQQMRDDENDVVNITKDIGNIHKELDKLKTQQKNLYKMA